MRLRRRLPSTGLLRTTDAPNSVRPAPESRAVNDIKSSYNCLSTQSVEASDVHTINPATAILAIMPRRKEADCGCQWAGRRAGGIHAGLVDDERHRPKIASSDRASVYGTQPRVRGAGDPWIRYKPIRAKAAMSTSPFRGRAHFFYAGRADNHACRPGRRCSSAWRCGRDSVELAAHACVEDRSPALATATPWCLPADHAPDGAGFAELLPAGRRHPVSSISSLSGCDWPATTIPARLRLPLPA